MMEVLDLSKFEIPLPRRICVRPKRGDWDPWQPHRLSFQIHAAAIACLAVGVFLCRVTVVATSHIGLALLVFGGLLCCYNSLGIPFTLYEIVQDRYFVRYGQAAIAEIVSREPSGNYDGYSCIYYRFMAESGEEISGEWLRRWGPLATGETGDKFIMLYKPVRPNDHMAYQSALYEVDN